MNITDKELGPLRIEVTVSFEQDEFAKETQTIEADVTKNAEVPGFRSGKAPISLLRKRYAKLIQEELEKSLIRKAFDSIAEDDVYDIFQWIELKSDRLKEDKEIVIILDKNPQFELPAYKEIVTKVKPIEINDSEIEEEMDNLYRDHGSQEETEEPSKTEDYVKIDYAGEVDGQAISELVPEDHQCSVWYKIEEPVWACAGKHSKTDFFLPTELREALLGMKKGDKKVVDVSITEDWKVETLLGKTAQYSLEVLQVQTTKLPETWDPVFEALKLETIEEVREHVRTRIKNRKEQEKKSDQEKQIKDAILTHADFDIPQSALDPKIELLLEAKLDQIELGEGATDEEKQRHAEAKEECRESAVQELQLEFIIAAIAKKESIQVTTEELKEMIELQARYSFTPANEIIKYYENNRDQLTRLHEVIRQRKTLGLLVDSTIEEPIEPNDSQAEESSETEKSSTDNNEEGKEETAEMTDTGTNKEASDSDAQASVTTEEDEKS